LGAIYGTVAKRHPDVEVIVPPRLTAVLSKGREITPTQHNDNSKILPSMNA
jgi:hypothetical protein